MLDDMLADSDSAASSEHTGARGAGSDGDSDNDAGAAGAAGADASDWGVEFDDAFGAGGGSGSIAPPPPPPPTASDAEHEHEQQQQEQHEADAAQDDAGIVDENVDNDDLRELIAQRQRDEAHGMSSDDDDDDARTNGRMTNRELSALRDGERRRAEVSKMPLEQLAKLRTLETPGLFSYVPAVRVPPMAADADIDAGGGGGDGDDDDDDNNNDDGSSGGGGSGADSGGGGGGRARTAGEQVAALERISRQLDDCDMNMLQTIALIERELLGHGGMSAANGDRLISFCYLCQHGTDAVNTLRAADDKVAPTHLMNNVWRQCERSCNYHQAARTVKLIYDRMVRPLLHGQPVWSHDTIIAHYREHCTNFESTTRFMSHTLQVGIPFIADKQMYYESDVTHTRQLSKAGLELMMKMWDKIRQCEQTLALIDSGDGGGGKGKGKGRV
jgi:hypothetical protein